jgi:hypothetical protein
MDSRQKTTAGERRDDMDTHSAYCSACDQQVRIALTPAPLHGGQATLPDAPDVVCLDFGVRCTGQFCPMFGLPRVVMGVRLARSELRTDGWTTVRGFCDGCERVTEMEVVNGTHAFCPICHTTNRFSVLSIDDGRYVVVGGGNTDDNAA